MSESGQLAFELEPLRRRNLLLRTLPGEEFACMHPLFMPVRLHGRDILVEQGQPIEHVYFPCSGVLSCVTYMANGDTIEVATIGNEGFSSVEMLTGAETALQTTVCQIEGTTLRIALTDLQISMEQSASLKNNVNRYFLAYLGLLSRSVACNRVHDIEQRLAKWLLMTQDRMDGGTLPLTHELLAIMLGVNRPYVSAVAEDLQRAGLIHYRRGIVEIVDRGGLEEISCECYAAQRRLFDPLASPGSTMGVDQGHPKH